MSDPSFGRVVGIGLLVIGGLSILGMGGTYMMSVAHVATAPARVISRTMDTDNIINNYEWFHDANGQFRSRMGQIADFKRQLADVGDDKGERNRLNVDLSGTRQSCRDLAGRYNANATKSNRSIFMGRDAPESLNMWDCDR